MINLQAAHRNMVLQQVRAWDVLDNQILQLMANIRREQFVPGNLIDLAYADTQLPIGNGQFMLRPALTGRILQAIKLRPTDNVLEIGTGTGYLSTCMSRLCQHVTSIELYKNLAALAYNRLSSLKIHNVELIHGDALKVLRGQKSFDVVVLTGSVTSLPANITNQTKYGGRLFAIMGNKQPMQACIFTRIDEGTWSKESLFETAVPQLEGMHTDDQFTF